VVAGGQALSDVAMTTRIELSKLLELKILMRGADKTDFAAA